ncbi:monocarboxylate transporter 12-like [Patiria miniata]|uniref:Major facilitator superfamily (MFS) profile domain-containing protein n=1 Tax=Patiria miniata TaxID=46514 RepID=A0A914AHF1_PATMI|nr:monocarboxylate transporter 12-like [Patiria miniata]
MYISCPLPPGTPSKTFEQESQPPRTLFLHQNSPRTMSGAVSNSLEGPDGGRPGWVAVLALWTKNLTEIGITKGLGIMLPILQIQLTSQMWILGWIASLATATSGFVAPFGGLVSRRFGAGYVMMTCGVMMSAAAIAGSFVENSLQLALLYTLLAGTAIGISNVVAKEAVGRCFTKNYATANGIARTGYSVGLIVFAPLVQLFLDTYGWRGTMLLVGAITMHSVASGAVMVATRQPELDQSNAYQTLPQTEHTNSPSAHESTLRSHCGSLWKFVSKNFEVGLLLNSRYWLVAVISCCTIYAYLMWIVYFVSQAQSNGFTLEEAGSFVTIAGIANLFGKISQGLITDRGVMSSWTLVAVCLVMSSVSYLASSLLTSYWPMMTSAVLILFSDGILSCQTDVLVKQVLGVELLAGAFGWIALKVTLLLVALGFLPGLVYDLTGSYTAAFLLIGSVQAVPLVPLLMLRYSQR